MADRNSQREANDEWDSARDTASPARSGVSCSVYQNTEARNSDERTTQYSGSLRVSGKIQELPRAANGYSADSYFPTA